MQLPCNIKTLKKTSKSYDSSSFLFVLGCVNMIFVVTRWRFSGADLEFQVRGSALKKIAPSGGRHENFGGFWCEKLRFYAQKIIFFPILGGGGRAPWIRPWFYLDAASYICNQSECLLQKHVYFDRGHMTALYKKNKNCYCPIEGPQGAKSLQWFINNNIKKYICWN